MGSPCEIQLYVFDEKQFQLVSQNIVNDMMRLEKKYSRYRDDSFLSEINRCAAIGGSIDVDAETAHLLNYAVTCYEQSDGLFDITSGVLRKIWQFNTATPAMPSEEEIDKILRFIGWDKVDWKMPKLSFPTPKLELDFGGIVKEYAADRAAALCSEMGIKHGIINLGGDIKVIGSHPDLSAWHIGIRDPENKNAVVNVVELTSGAMASSGDYERCIEIDGKRYGHILNPKTGYPVQHFSSITVISDYCVLAGSASTIAMLKEEEGISWLNRLNLPYQWIDINGQRGGNYIKNINN
ncbi:MAG: FAD:protein FMN transferase [Methylococcales bacterium]|nr:FAD:protein FMN transferase [Methylococcales bacterium]